MQRMYKEKLTVDTISTMHPRLIISNEINEGIAVNAIERTKLLIIIAFLMGDLFFITVLRQINGKYRKILEAIRGIRKIKKVFRVKYILYKNTKKLVKNKQQLFKIEIKNFEIWKM